MNSIHSRSNGSPLVSIPMINQDEEDVGGGGTLEEEDLSISVDGSSSSCITGTETTRLAKVDFLVSFLVDARGGTMTGCRHSGLRVIIPPKTAPQPMRITCRYFKEDSLLFPPTLNEGEGLACRILKVGPRGSKFLGPVLIEIPHVSSLNEGERELFVLRCNNGRKWVPHKLYEDFEAEKERVLRVATVIESMSMSSPEPPPEDLTSVTNISRYGSSAFLEFPPQPLRNSDAFFHILTHDFPQYFAVISRIRQDSQIVGAMGGTLRSSITPKVQVVFPPKAVVKDIRIGLSVKSIVDDLIQDFKLQGGSTSPCVTIEPRRRKFHRPVTVCIPLPERVKKGSEAIETCLKLVCSMSGNFNKAYWEDVTDTTPIDIVDGCIQFTSVISASFWLINVPKWMSSDVILTTDSLHKATNRVPYWTRFHAYARKRPEESPDKVQIRVLVLTEADRGVRPLELQEDFKEIARSDFVQVLEKTDIGVDFGGNLIIVEGEPDEWRRTFQPFSDNRQGFVIKRRKVHNPYGKGTIVFKSSNENTTLFEAKIDVSKFL